MVVFFLLVGGKQPVLEFLCTHDTIVVAVNRGHQLVDLFLVQTATKLVDFDVQEGLLHQARIEHATLQRRLGKFCELLQDCFV